MIGLDTNIIIRYLTQDDPVQSPKASKIIEQAEVGTLFIPNIVMCETVWVLANAYQQSRQQIAEILEKILSIAPFSFENKDLLWGALRDYRAGKADFADYVIGRAARLAGCENCLTFDRALRNSDLFQLLG